MSQESTFEGRSLVCSVLFVLLEFQEMVFIGSFTGRIQVCRAIAGKISLAEVGGTFLKILSRDGNGGTVLLSL